MWAHRDVGAGNLDDVTAAGRSRRLSILLGHARKMLGGACPGAPDQSLRPPKMQVARRRRPTTTEMRPPIIALLNDCLVEI